jgi:hypothetical protein
MNATVKALSQAAPVETVIRTPSLDEAGFLSYQMFLHLGRQIH